MLQYNYKTDYKGIREPILPTSTLDLRSVRNLADCSGLRIVVLLKLLFFVFVVLVNKGLPCCV